MTISDDLQWDTHISNIARKGNTSLHFIYRNLKHCPNSARSTAYCSLTRPLLEYCSPVWDPHEAQHVQELERVNRRGARTVFNKTWRERDVSVSDLLNQLEWQSLERRRKDARMCMMYRVHHQLITVPHTGLHSPVRDLRFTHLRSTHLRVQNSFFHTSIPEWNRLLSDTVTATSIDSFRARLTKP